MNAKFKISAPLMTDVTLTISGPMSEFAAIRDALDTKSPHANAFWRQLNDLIGTTEKTLAAEHWTTGWASGETKET